MENSDVYRFEKPVADVFANGMVVGQIVGAGLHKSFEEIPQSINNTNPNIERVWVDKDFFLIANIYVDDVYCKIKSEECIFEKGDYKFVFYKFKMLNLVDDIESIVKMLISEESSFKKEVEKVADSMAAYSQKVNLIFFAVYGFYKLNSDNIEPKLITEPITSKCEENKLKFRQIYKIQIGETMYPILENTEQTLLNIIQGEK